jgi:trk system potassium uptake protein
MPKADLAAIIIAGASRVGRLLAEQFVSAGETVAVIDTDESQFSRFTVDFQGQSLIGDASSIEILRLAGISKAKAVFAVTNDDSINLMIADIASSIYDVPTVIALVDNVGQLQVEEAFGFRILCPAQVLASLMVTEMKAKEGTDDENTCHR